MTALDDLCPESALAYRSGMARLRDEFDASVGETTIGSIFDASWRHIDADARIKLHVPILAEKLARGQLWAMARMNGHHDGVPAVLFVDVHDAGRGKMAKALLVDRLGSGVIAMSAGTKADQTVPPAVAEAMSEIGLSVEHSFPKPFTPEMLRAADHIVAFENGTKLLPAELPRVAWSIDDPSTMSLDEVRAVRDDLRSRVDGLVNELRLTAA